jgi:putative ABC transport system permease protein
VRFIFRLAASNLKKNADIYLPYIITSSVTVMMFYLIIYLAKNEAIIDLPGSAALRSTLTMGIIVVGLYSLIFLFYTNSFIVKRRKREFGIFNILGMEKRHIAATLAAENLYITLATVGCGLATGILFSKLMLLALAKLLGFNVAFGFSVSVEGIIMSLIFFGIVFTLTLVFDLTQLQLSKPVELLSGTAVGEREPKTRWLLAIVGAVTLGFGYYLALTIKSPIAALSMFFFAVILVIIGTYCLFTAGSIAVLKLMRRNKRYYYKPRHFTTVSGMLWRMKRSAVSLSNICILSTMVLVTVSTTVSLFVGFEDALKIRYPRNAIFDVSSVDATEDGSGIPTAITADDAEAITSAALAAVGNRPISGMYGYRYCSANLQRSGNSYSAYDVSAIDATDCCFIPLESYNNMTGSEVVLGDDEILAWSPNMTLESGAVIIQGAEYTARVLDEFPVPPSMISTLGEVVYFVMTDSAIDGLYSRSVIDPSYQMRFELAFDIEGSETVRREVCEAVHAAIYAANTRYTCRFDAEYELRAEIYNIYGGLFFLGIFLGSLFLMAAVLIIYYKQITEGYEDRERFVIMRDVGMSTDEVKASIRSQVLTVFFLPLVTAFVHIGFAFPMINKIMGVIGLSNMQLFLMATCICALVFAVIYISVYSLTARAYYRIVR